MKSRRAILGGFSAGAAVLAAGPVWSAAAQPPPQPRSVVRETSGFTFSSGVAATEWLPFEMPDLRHIVMAVTINGVPASTILDTGVGTAVLAREFAMKLGLIPVGAMTGVGLGGGAKGLTVGGVTIGLGALTFETAGASIFDLSAIETAARQPIDAVLGRDVFDLLMLDLDFAAGKLSFRQPDRAYRVPGAVEIALMPADFGLRSLPISIEGGPPTQALLDLGADRPLAVSPSYAARRNLARGHRVSTTMSAGVGGFDVSKILAIGSLKVGPTDFVAVPAEIPATWSYGVDAVVGFPVFRRFRLLVDFPNNRLDAAPMAGVAPFRKDRAGIGARRDGNQLEIMHVAEGSPAAQVGLVVGDRIVAVDGHPLDDAYFKENTRNGSRPAGTPVSFVLSDGRTIDFLLADYF